MIPPSNDYIVISTAKSDFKDSGGPIVPDTANPLREGIVIDPGQPFCVIQWFDKGMSEVITKEELWPGLVKGAKVLYRKVAEERLTMDQAYRITTEGKEQVLYIKISDIIGVLPPEK